MTAIKADTVERACDNHPRHRGDHPADQVSWVAPELPRRGVRSSLTFPFHALRRALGIGLLSLLFLPRLGVAVWLTPKKGPVLARRYLQACGGAFIKLGQIAAMRHDLLPQEYCDELAKLLDQLPPIPAEVVERAVLADLGLPLGEMFVSFAATPLGSGSIAQVHAAVTTGGEEVVVKVMRPRMEWTFRVDLWYLQTLTRVTRRLRAARRLNLEGVARELIEAAREELDFRREARTTRLIHQLMASDAVDHCAPAVFFDYSGPHVITMERIAGVPMTELLGAVQRADHQALEGWAARGITPPTVARSLVRSILEQAIVHRVFNADPHAANLIVKDGGTLGWVDFGMVGWLDEQTWMQLFRLCSAIAAEQVHAACEALLDSLQPLPERDLSEFGIQVKAIIRDWILASKDPQATVWEKSATRFLTRVFGAMRRAGLTVPVAMMRVYRAVMMGDLVLRLDPTLDWLGVLRDFLLSETRRHIRDMANVERTVALLAGTIPGWLRISPMLSSLVNWAESRVPAMGRAYRRRSSCAERVGRILLGYCRAAVVLAVLVVLVAQGDGPHAGWMATVHRTTSGHAAEIALAGAAVTLLLGRIRREMETFP